MAKEDVLNARQGYDPDLGFSPNPDFGYTRKDPARTVWTKPSGGMPTSRDVLNDGYSFPLQWTGRPRECIQRVRRFFNQFKRGCFTFIDWEDGGRQYVGRITQIGDQTAVKNKVFNLTGVIFTEIPTLAMGEYPQDWDGDAIYLYPFNDLGGQDLASQGIWTATDRADIGTTMDSAGTTVGDWAQYEYVGYGFKLRMMTGPAFGKVDVYLDGTLLQTVDLYTGALQGPIEVVTKPDVPLDFHRIKVLIRGDKNALATAAGASWHSLVVIP